MVVNYYGKTFSAASPLMSSIFHVYHCVFFPRELKIVSENNDNISLFTPVFTVWPVPPTHLS